VLSAGVLGNALYLILLMLGGLGLGPRVWLTGLSSISAACVGAVMLLHDDLQLMAAALLGALSGTTAAGAWHPLLQDALSHGTPPETHPRVFARYRLVLALAAAAGSAAAGLPAWLAPQLGYDEPGLRHMLFGAVALAFVLTALCFARVQHPPHVLASRKLENPLRTPSRRTILWLCGFFGVDNLGSSIASASLVTLWFRDRHGLSVDAIGLLLSATFALNAASMWLSGRLAPRLGLVPTMVFTHVPSCVLLIVVAFAPSASLAVSAFLLRALLSNMDVPPRDAFSVAVVAPEERVTMASAQLLARSAFGAPGPIVATWVWQAFGPAAPFALGGALKIAYDLGLYAVFAKHPASTAARAATRVRAGT
jgi:MFS family permease